MISHNMSVFHVLADGIIENLQNALESFQELMGQLRKAERE